MAQHESSEYGGESIGQILIEVSNILNIGRKYKSFLESYHSVSVS